MIKLRILRWENYPGLSGWPSIGPHKREAGGSERKRLNEADSWLWRRGRGHKSRNVGDFQQLSKIREWILPRVSRKNTGL